VLTEAAMQAIFRFGVAMGWVLAACALAGIGLRMTW
jgi:Na+-transporting NADH:ubiquinone oxidoreductase subunit NqrE